MKFNTVKAVKDYHRKQRIEQGVINKPSHQVHKSKKQYKRNNKVKSHDYEN